MPKPDVLPLHTIMPLVKQLEKLPVSPALTFQQAISLVRYHIAPHTQNGSMILHHLFEDLHLVHNLSMSALKEFYLNLLRFENNMKVKLFLPKWWRVRMFGEEAADSNPSQAAPGTPPHRKNQGHPPQATPRGQRPHGPPRRPHGPQHVSPGVRPHHRRATEGFGSPPRNPAHRVGVPGPPQRGMRPPMHQTPMPQSPMTPMSQAHMPKEPHSNMADRPHPNVRPPTPHHGHSARPIVAALEKRSPAPTLTYGEPLQEAASFVTITPPKAMVRNNQEDSQPSFTLSSCPSTDGLPSCEDAPAWDSPSDEKHLASGSFSSCQELQGQEVPESEVSIDSSPGIKVSVAPPKSEDSVPAQQTYKPKWVSWQSLSKSGVRSSGS